MIFYHRIPPIQNRTWNPSQALGRLFASSGSPGGSADLEDRDGLVFSGALSGMVIGEIVRQVQQAVVRVVGSDIDWIDWKEQ